MSPSPIRYRQGTNRDIIEADLFHLRAQNSGFVRKESRRYSISPINTDNDNDEKQKMTPKRRWWRVGGNHANKSGLHFFRKPKLSQLLIPGRRSWWPDGKAPLVPLVSSPTNTECTSMSDDDDDNDDERKSNKPNRKNTTKPKNKKGKKQHIFFSPTKELLIDEVPSEDCDAKQKRYRKKHQWKFWLPKEKRNMLTYDEDGSTRDDMHTNNGVNKIKKKALSTRDIPEKDEEDRKPGRNDKKKEYEKELKKRIVEAVTAASVSTIGVVVAIILL